MDQDYKSLLILPVSLIALWLINFWSELEGKGKFLFCTILFVASAIGILWFIEYRSKWARERIKQLEEIRKIPPDLVCKTSHSVYVGYDVNLDIELHLPDDIRSRHVHVLGATGSGKTESVILNFLRQDVNRGLGSIILDAKGDASFVEELERIVPSSQLRLFDLASEDSTAFDPLFLGSPLESAQRLFSSLVWSEEYYKSKALSALQRLFQAHYEINRSNPTLGDLEDYLDTVGKYAAFLQRKEKEIAQEYDELAGLRDQIRSLNIAHLGRILSPENGSGIDLSEAKNGVVIYFRLQSLMSPQLVGTVGRLLINNLNFLAGTAHRRQVEANAKQRKLVSIYLDEFASFACAEFADLISKARSAGFALHFSHQSIGDLTEVSPGFLNRITDNAATKIVMRINDPDSAEYFARSFGTKDIQKTTQRITNTEEIDDAEIVGEGTTRDAHQFRASPDLLKTLPTGYGSVLVAHGRDGSAGGSHVFKVRFPKLMSNGPDI